MTNSKKWLKPTPIIVPHQERDLRFTYLPLGFYRDTYPNIRRTFEQTHLLKPTIAQTVSLLERLFRDNTEVCESSVSPEIDIMKSNLRHSNLYVFIGSLWTPEGVYVQDDPEIIDERVYMDRDNLREKLETGDSSVRFVPKNKIKLKDMASGELAKNEYLIALAGEEGAEKLARISRRFKEQPYLGGQGGCWPPNEGNIQYPSNITVCSIRTEIALWGSGLYILGNTDSLDKSGFGLCIEEDN